MKIITIFGTRPQYIKLKPFYDYCKKENINNYIVDTNQHYSANVSDDLVEELELEIDHNLKIQFKNEKDFLSNSFHSIYDMLEEMCDSRDNTVVVIGDTNSALVASIVAKKMGMKLAHIEAGIRGKDHSIKDTEEINRTVIDSISDIHFVARKRDAKNVSNPVYIGDLEYNFLNSIESKYSNISYGGPILMTIHRQENMDKKRLKNIFSLCEKLEYPIIFPMHHRTKIFMGNNSISIPSNIEVVEPMSYFKIIDVMRSCKGIITDSGGILKTSAFFGKKCILPSEQWEWSEIFDKGYATNILDRHWFDDYKIDRNMNLYYVENSCEIIANKIMGKE